MSAFFKLSGSGNDFLALVSPTTIPRPEQIRAWCRRGVSLGADGLFVLEKIRAGAEMRHFNSDGTASELCINGTRCAAQLAFQLGWAKKSIEIQTGAGPIRARRIDRNVIALDLGEPECNGRACTLDADGTSVEGLRVQVGVPHFVVPWPATLARAPVHTLGAILRSHPFFGDEGTNVDFVRFPQPHRLEIRSFERGVDAETLACGTGVLASVAAGMRLGRCGSPVTALTAGGFELEVTAGEAGTWSLAGDARVLASGTLGEGAECELHPVRWT